MRGLKQTFNYGNDSLSITEILEKPEVVNYLEKGRRLTYASLRDKLRKHLRKNGNDLQRLVDEYNLNNPQQQQQQQGIRNFVYGAQRHRQPRQGSINVFGKILRLVRYWKDIRIFETNSRKTG